MIGRAREKQTEPFRAEPAAVSMPSWKVWWASRLPGAEAFRRVFAGTTVNSWDKSSVQHVCELTERLVSALPVYELSCTPDRAAVELLRAELERKA